MAFVGANFITDSGANTDAARLFRYRTTTDTLAAVKGANYFDNASAITGGYGLRNKDVIFVEASDGQSFLFMAVDAAGAATTTSANDFA